MLERGQELRFRVKPLEEILAGQMRRQNFHGDAFFKLPVHTFRQVHGAHSPAAHQTHEWIDAEVLGWNDGFRTGSDGRRLHRYREMRREERGNLGYELRVIAAASSEPGALSVESESDKASWKIGSTWWMEGIARTVQ